MVRVCVTVEKVALDSAGVPVNPTSSRNQSHSNLECCRHGQGLAGQSLRVKAGGRAAQGLPRSFLVVLPAPAFDFNSCTGQAVESVLVKALISRARPRVGGKTKRMEVHQHEFSKAR